MDQVENTNPKVKTSSDLSEFVGPTVQASRPVPTPRKLDPTVEADQFDFTNRLFALHELTGPGTMGWLVGPSSITDRAVNLFDVFRNAEILTQLLSKFHALSYDSIDIRMTVSDPKSMVGGLFSGWLPFVDYNDSGPYDYFSTITSAGSSLFPSFANGCPYTEFSMFGMSKDTTWTIPWTFKTPVLQCDTVYNLDDTGPNQRPVWGQPWFWFRVAENTSYVTNVPNPTHLKIFARFNGLRFYGPKNYDFAPPPLSYQSGLEAVAIAQVAGAVATSIGVDAMSTAFLDSIAPPTQEISEMASFGTYDEPQGVQLAYFGDTTSCDYPSLTPIFSPYLNSATVPVPTVHDFLARPQYVGWGVSNSTAFNLVNNPCAFTDVSVYPDTVLGTWFRFFAMLNRYWRGTINVHVLVAGHPLVECASYARVGYNSPDLINLPNVSCDYAVHTDVFPASKHLVYPLPYLSSNDYMPVMDAYPSDPYSENSFTTKFEFQLSVTSYVTPVVPTIPFYVFVSASPDFAFYYPIPPGLYNAAELESDVKVEQIGLPLLDQVDIGRTRAECTRDPGTLVSLSTMDDYMKIWSRAIPFSDYANDSDEEPTPDAGVGFSCASWYPPVDRTLNLDVNNSWYFTLDYIALFSSCFLYYKGGMAYKIAVSTSRDAAGFAYVSLGDALTIDRVTNDFIPRAKTHVPFPYSDTQLPPQSNFGSGTVVTPVQQQPVLEFALPYRGSNIWSYSFWNAYTRPFAITYKIYPNANVNHNIVLQNPDDDTLEDAMFRKISPNFSLAVEAGFPPFTMWAARGFDWSA